MNGLEGLNAELTAKNVALMAENMELKKKLRLAEIDARALGGNLARRSR